MTGKYNQKSKNQKIKNKKTENIKRYRLGNLVSPFYKKCLSANKTKMKKEKKKTHFF
uniref:Uncharacterized protein n=1 Tax=viral metagenome TaxID=1070528 RepID=A0A6C0CRR7_9ZZZZ